MDSIKFNCLYRACYRIVEVITKLLLAVILTKGE
jgi:hypothetical protein